MPRRTDIEKILVLGSGPVIVGQACEYDYSVTQAMRALKKVGYKTVLVNSNPAAVMTDPEISDATYIEPLLPQYVEKIIEQEQPDALLPTMGGQTALNLASSLFRRGVLKRSKVELIGASYEAIHKSEDREAFKETVEGIGLLVPAGGIARTIEEAEELALHMSFPLIIRPAFTLDGTGGSIAYNLEEYIRQAQWGLALSPISEVLVEQSISEWKEIELEVMRDSKDNVIIVCFIENMDPMGIHTGDSFAVAPAQTLSDQDREWMRDAAARIIREIGVTSGCANIQFAVNPDTGEILLIGMNPRFTRSSALASKATGFPIAKAAAMFSVGLTLDEIPEGVLRKNQACAEPTVDHVVVKAPRWDFGKFVGADRTLGTQMKSTGEVMAIGRTFKEALGKALRSLETGVAGLQDVAKIFDHDEVEDYDGAAEELESIRCCLRSPTCDRLFWIGSAFRAGMNPDEIGELTRIDPWFLRELKEIVEIERKLKSIEDAPCSLDSSTLKSAKESGFSDAQLALLWSVTEKEIRDSRHKAMVRPVYRMVDNQASDDVARYSTYTTFGEEEEEKVRYEAESCKDGKRHRGEIHKEETGSVTQDIARKVAIVGGGPDRVGQGIELDYCSVHAVETLRTMNVRTIMINCNPKSVSTDCALADRLYVEPLTSEDVIEVLNIERPDGVILQFGGKTSLKLADTIRDAGFRILGTSRESMELAEDRERLGRLVAELGIRMPTNDSARSVEEALAAAERVGYPVLVRTFGILGRQDLEIVYDPSSLKRYLKRIKAFARQDSLLIDRFLEDAFEADVDALCDGKDVFVAGIMQQIEEAGIHSGDSSCVYPCYWITAEQQKEIRRQTEKLALALDVRGFVNIQFALKDGEVYILEVNLRASRTVPYLSKSIGIPLAGLATKIMMGERLSELVKDVPIKRRGITVKAAVFSFDKFPGARPFLGPEMKSTGEVMGLGESFAEAFGKAQLAAGNMLPVRGTVFLSVNDGDKPKALALARAFRDLGFSLMATGGTRAYLSQNGLDVKPVYKVKEGRPNVADRIINGEIQLVVNTPLGKVSRYDEYAINQTAIRHRVPCLTTLTASWAAVEAIQELRNGALTVRSLQKLDAAGDDEKR